MKIGIKIIFLFTMITVITIAASTGPAPAKPTAAAKKATTSITLPTIDWTKVDTQLSPNAFANLTSWSALQKQNFAAIKTGEANLDGVFRQIATSIDVVMTKLQSFYDGNSYVILAIDSIVKEALTTYFLVQSLVVDAVDKKAPVIVQTVMINVYNSLGNAIVNDATKVESLVDTAKKDAAKLLASALLLPATVGIYVAMTAAKKQILTFDKQVGTKVQDAWKKQEAITGSDIVNTAWQRAYTNNASLLDAIKKQAISFLSTKQ